jgi:hypothetical protein
MRAVLGVKRSAFYCGGGTVKVETVALRSSVSALWSIFRALRGFPPSADMLLLLDTEPAFCVSSVGVMVEVVAVAGSGSADTGVSGSLDLRWSPAFQT